MTDDIVDLAGLGACPIPISDYPNVLLAHGGGGSLSQMLVENMFAATFANDWLDPLHDGAVIDVVAGRMAVSTDSFVISPLFFPGGDIGSLAVHGTVNDVAMCGATPIAITVGMVIEEGLPMEDLWRIVSSMKRAADEAGVAVATGDTKVVDRGKGDGIFINTTGFGMVREGIDIRPNRMRASDVVIVSGTIADHGIAIMSVREGLEFETALESDSASLNGLVDATLDAGGAAVHVLRDPTRGGVASATNEIAKSAGLGIRLRESALPINDQVRAACEILGFDPLYVANEGKCIVIVDQGSAEEVLAAMHGHPLGRSAAVVGEVVEDHPGRVFLTSSIGGNRVVDMISGEQLPRIC
ncbi:MAG TPA: hydrogenase expression/formation protein HypE [Acidimicrobiia bacterium]|nr:hydrogenase expression/formation protein HypE [Acidimicrobiia bacterium]